MNNLLGSEIFGTSDMKAEECIIFVKSAISIGVDINTANDDMHMIDNMLHIKRLHFAVQRTVKYTAKGNLRKNHTLSNAYMDIIESRLNTSNENRL